MFYCVANFGFTIIDSLLYGSNSILKIYLLAFEICINSGTSLIQNIWYYHCLYLRNVHNQELHAIML